VEEGNRDPWDERHGALSPELQAQCYEQVYKAFYNKPWFEGMYWWKVGTNGFEWAQRSLAHTMGKAGDGSDSPVVPQ
jgi:hypothetical protein